MASEIIVNTIKAPTSGANANKIIVGPGQELDASNGFIPPAGHILKTAHYKGNTSGTSSGSAWVDSTVVFNYTPLKSTSLIIANCSVVVWRSSTSAYAGVRVNLSGGKTGTVATYGDMYYNGGGANTWDTPYSFSYTSGTTSQITHTFQFHPNGGGMWFPNNAPNFSPDSRWTVTLWEVEQ